MVAGPHRIALALLLGLTVARPADAGDAPEERPRVLAHAAIDVGPSPPVSARVVRRVDALVKVLRTSDTPRPGLTSWQAGGPYFEPAEGGDLDAAPGAKTTAERAFRELVAMGPASMPALLEHLDDPTPTGIVIRHGGGFGAMWLGSEVGVNPALPDEARVVRTALGEPQGVDAEDDIDWGRQTDRHVVTVGDVCFALLGQVTNRPYEAVRGQPTFCIVVNSPTSDPRIARAVRAQWEGQDLRRALARRLGEDLWTSGDDRYATGALLRLLAWFPETVEPVVVRLLDAVDAEAEAAGTSDLPLGIEPVALADRAGAVDRPAVRAALVRLAGRARDPEVVRTALSRLPDLRDPALHDHLRSVIDGSVRVVGKAFAVEGLLREIEKRWPDRYEEAVRRVLTRHGIEGVYVVVSIAHDRGTPLPLEAWRPLLDVPVKATEWQRTPPGPLERLRVCDVAAQQISRLRPDLPFDEAAEEPVRDRQIEAMRRALDASAKGGRKEGK